MRAATGLPPIARAIGAISLSRPSAPPAAACLGRTSGIFLTVPDSLQNGGGGRPTKRKRNSKRTLEGAANVDQRVTVRFAD